MTTNLTPEELAKLAGMCGLETGLVPPNVGGHASYFTDGAFYCYCAFWHPESNDAHSWRLMEKLIAATPCLSFFAEEIDGRFTVENHRFRNSGATTAEALCKLALEVWENEN